jgi:hypothetical protein
MAGSTRRLTGFSFAGIMDEDTIVSVWHGHSSCHPER